MPNRKRNIQMKFWVAEDEKQLIDEKMKLLPTQRIGAGAPIYQADMEEIKERLDEIWQLQRHILSNQR